MTIYNDNRNHARFENTQDEAHAANFGNVRNKRGEDGAESEAEGRQRNEPARTHVFAEQIRGDLEDDVADVEDGEDEVVVVSLHPEVFFQTGETRIS
ncbi:hypothetical protein HG530_015272 [Fusarium avenaceum]|nr:hypothetical protein HG530_015272 [Fusarium avenaceum]